MSCNFAFENIACILHSQFDFYNPPRPNSLRLAWKVVFHLSPKIRSYKWGQKEKRRKIPEQDGCVT